MNVLYCLDGLFPRLMSEFLNCWGGYSPWPWRHAVIRLGRPPPYCDRDGEFTAS